MSKNDFKAFIVKEKNGKYEGRVENKQFDELPAGDLLIKVEYSSLNYKDALSAAGNKGVTKQFPHTPGIDAAGTIAESESPMFKKGDSVIVTSYDLGMNTSGGFAEYIRVPADWAVNMPENLSSKEAMMYGTAGLTAGMSVQRLTEFVKPEDGPIIVSGATGGVGSVSIAILNKLGYQITAVSGKESAKDFLKELGADEIISRKDFTEMASKPLLKPIAAGAVDTVGGVILENIIKSVGANGTVTCCGNAASPKLELTVFPFILRGVTLIGIDSQNYPMENRKTVWKKLSQDWKIAFSDDSYSEISLDELPEKTKLMLEGKLKGRTIIKIQ